MKPLMVGNWKMAISKVTSLEICNSLKEINTDSCCDIWVAPSYTAIDAVSQSLKGTNVRVGAQNVHHALRGAFTGEVSVSMINELGGSFAIVGHSERRHIFSESSTLVGDRSNGALSQGLEIIFCIGERLEERESGTTVAVIKEQLQGLAQNWQPQYYRKLILAYEPVWAIGTGKVASVDQIQETLASLVAVWQELFNLPPPRVLYGGSVDAANVKGILSVEHVSGCLVGGASQSAEKFVDLLRAVRS